MRHPSYHVAMSSPGEAEPKAATGQAAKSDDDVAARWQGAGLFDPESPNADEILEVLRFYASIGVEPDTHEGIDRDDPIRDINKRILAPGDRFDAAVARERVGVSAEEFELLRVASGYAADDLYTDLDVASFQGFVLAREFFTTDELLAFTRTLAATMSNLADASVSLFRIDVASEMDQRGATEVDFARKNHEASVVLEQLFVPMQAMFRRQLLKAISRADEARITDHTGLSNLNMAVGFVDIVGFTARTENMPAGELDQFIRAFEQQAFQVVEALGGRVVKLIGDEVMFIDADPTNAVRIAAALIEAFDDLGALPRAGVAFGELISRGGDYYGRVVNLASRLAGQADAGQIVTDDASAAAMTNVEQTTLGPVSLKGFSAEVDLVAISSRRSDEDSG